MTHSTKHKYPETGFPYCAVIHFKNYSINSAHWAHSTLEEGSFRIRYMSMSSSYYYLFHNECDFLAFILAFKVDDTSPKRFL